MKERNYLMKKQKIFISIMLSLLFSGTFNIDDNSSSQIQFTMGEVQFEEFNEYKKIISNSKGVTQHQGAPELPTYSMNYAIEANIQYSVNYNVTEYETYENMKIYCFFHFSL